MKVKILDWTGKDVYPGRSWDSTEEAWAFLTEDQHKRHPNATEKEFDDIMGEFETSEKPTPKGPKTLAELGQIMLARAGADACQEGYGTTDPEWVGRYALEYKDINPDGTLN